MKRVICGLSLERAKQLHEELGKQVRAAEAHIVQGHPIDGMIELHVDALTTQLPAEPVALEFSNDDMERDEVRDQILIGVEG